MIKTSKEYARPKNFPLSPHKRGWCKQIRGRVVIICGHLPPKKALAIYHQKIPKLYPPASVVSPSATPAPVPLALPIAPVVVSATVQDLQDKYITHKTREHTNGEYAARSLMSLREILPIFAEAYPGPFLNLTPQDFADYRAKLAARYCPNALNRHVMNIRAMFKWAYRNCLIPQLPKWGDSFEKPTASDLRKHRQQVKIKDGAKLFTPDQIRNLLSLAKRQMRAMILLGVNCGMGNGDVSQLPMSVIDLNKRIIDFPRPKTGEERRCALWPETVKAIRTVIKHRPVAADPADGGLLFLTKTGLRMVRVDAARGTRVDYVTLHFRDLIQKAGMEQNGRSFYALRHTFRTTASQCTDRDAVDRIMGHSLKGMASAYVQEIGDDRLRRVAKYVRQQILGTGKRKNRVKMQIVSVNSL